MKCTRDIVSDQGKVVSTLEVLAMTYQNYISINVNFSRMVPFDISQCFINNVVVVRWSS